MRGQNFTNISPAGNTNKTKTNKTHNPPGTRRWNDSGKCKNLRVNSKFESES